MHPKVSTILRNSSMKQTLVGSNLDTSQQPLTPGCQKNPTDELLKVIIFARVLIFLQSGFEKLLGMGRGLNPKPQISVLRQVSI